MTAVAAAAAAAEAAAEGEEEDMIGEEAKAGAKKEALWNLVPPVGGVARPGKEKGGRRGGMRSKRRDAEKEEG